MDNFNIKAIGRNIDHLRHMRHMTVQELADATGFSSMQFYHWKQGRNAPQLRTLYVLAKYFGVSMDELMKGVDKE